MTEERGVDMTPLVVHVPMELHRKFKAACAAQDISMKQAITRFMREFSLEIPRHPEHAANPVRQ